MRELLRRRRSVLALLVLGIVMLSPPAVAEEPEATEEPTASESASQSQAPTTTSESSTRIGPPTQGCRPACL